MLTPGGDLSIPNNVRSKSSILAKHLYYDQTITTNYDLKCEVCRRKFLLENCYILVAETNTREQAHILELRREQGGTFR